MSRFRRAFILGAGFSHHLGLPLQSGFTKHLLDVSKRKLSKPTMEKIKSFVKYAFHPDSELPENWPDLEDIFTSIDMSANTGHNLGPSYTPSELRTIRRLLLSRTIRMLHQDYIKAKNKKDDRWQTFKTFLGKLDPSLDAFVILNWDTVLEAGLADTREVKYYSYGCGEKPAEFPEKGEVIELLPGSGDEHLFRIIKMHGSINWLYCDNCRRLFYFSPRWSEKIATQIVSKEELNQVVGEEKASALVHFKCKYCPEVDLTTRIATFSYLKVLNFSILQRSWFAAEKVLRSADHWIFIGYSLPGADYEFKYLLKRIQLSKERRPQITLVTGPDNSEATKLNYQRFFGDTFSRSFFAEGLTDSVIKDIFKGKRGE